MLQFLFVVFFHMYRYCNTSLYSFGQNSTLGKKISFQIVQMSQLFDWNGKLSNDAWTSADGEDYRLFESVDDCRECGGYTPPLQREKPTNSSISLGDRHDSELSYENAQV